MAERNVPSGQAGQQGPNDGGALPREDALGSVNPAEHFHDGVHGHRVGGADGHQSSQVVAKRAAGALPAPVDLTFDVTGCASVVLGDACAGQADWPGIGAVGAAGQYANVSADRADASGAHRSVEAAVAELLVWPGRGPVLSGHPAASGAAQCSFGAGSSACSGWPVGVNRHRGAHGRAAAARICRSRRRWAQRTSPRRTRLSCAGRRLR